MAALRTELLQGRGFQQNAGGGGGGACAVTQKVQTGKVSAHLADETVEAQGGQGQMPATQ